MDRLTETRIEALELTARMLMREIFEVPGLRARLAAIEAMVDPAAKVHAKVADSIVSASYRPYAPYAPYADKADNPSERFVESARLIESSTGFRQWSYGGSPPVERGDRVMAVFKSEDGALYADTFTAQSFEYAGSWGHQRGNDRIVAYKILQRANWMKD